MSSKSGCPTGSRMAALSALEGHVDINIEGCKAACFGKPPGKRQVFVQMDTGLMVDLDLDCWDNAHTVKRKLQIALNVPIDGNSLVFGDLVLRNNVTIVHSNSPVLLMSMRQNSSSKCLEPIGGEFVQKEDSVNPTSKFIEILGSAKHSPLIKQLVMDATKAARAGIDPVPIARGLGGSYCLQNTDGDSIAIVKPIDEEPFAPNNPKGFVGKVLGQPGLKRSVRVGETGFREVAAYLLDHGNFANVPLTALVKIAHSIFCINGCGVPVHLASKIASFQQYVPHDFDAMDHGTSGFPVSAVHRIGILDIRILNTDRHAGNVLVRKLDYVGIGSFGHRMELIPIDHGLCLPENLEDPYFEWIHWPQAAVPFSEEELEYIAGLDPVRDAEMLRMELPMIREACLRVLILCTVFLKEATSAGLCLAEIGEMMTREFRAPEEEPSELEALCMEAQRVSAAATGKEITFSPRRTDNLDGSNGFHLQFDLESGRETNTPGLTVDEAPLDDTSRLPAPLKAATGGVHGMNRSAEGQVLGSSVCFVRVSDMGTKEWEAFMDAFQELLADATRNRRGGFSGQRQKQRLGTSCKF